MVEAIRDLVDLKLYHREIDSKRGLIKDLTEKQCHDILFDREPQYAPLVASLDGEKQLAVVIAVLIHLMLHDIATDPHLTADIKKSQITFVHDVFKNGKISGNNMNCGTHLWHIDLLFWAQKKIDPLQAAVINESINRSFLLLNEGGYSLLSDTITEYNYHGHCIWGLLAICIVKLAGKHEYRWLSKSEHLANALGLFRFKWESVIFLKERVKLDASSIPKEIYSLYLGAGLDSLLGPKAMETGKYVVNHLVIDAFTQLPNCLQLLQRIKDDPALFRLCAIPLAAQFCSLCRIFNSSLKDLAEKGWIKEVELARLHSNISDFVDIAVLIEGEMKKLLRNVRDTDLLKGELAICCSQVISVCQSGQKSAERTFVPWELSSGTLIELLIIALLGAITLSLIEL